MRLMKRLVSGDDVPNLGELLGAPEYVLQVVGVHQVPVQLGLELVSLVNELDDASGVAAKHVE